MGINIEVPISELQKCKLFVATPMYGGQCFGSYTKSILDLSRVATQYGIETQFSFLFNESLITRARNYLVDEFLRSGATHLMFIDSDIDFNPMDVIALIALNKPVIGGPYPKKCIAWENIYDAARFGLVPSNDRGKLQDFAGDFVFNAVAGTTEIKLDAPAEVLEIGTGFMLVERGVFEKFAVAYPDYWYTPDHNRSTAFDGSRKIYQYFQAEIEKERNRYLSEDYWFCQMARKADISVWLCPWMQVKHHGTMIYGGSIPAMATVINERIQRKEPVPTVAVMDPGSVAVKTVIEGSEPLSIAKFSDFSSAARKTQFAEWGTLLGVDPEVLAEAYKVRYKQWLKDVPDIPAIEKVTDLANEIKTIALAVAAEVPTPTV